MTYGLFGTRFDLEEFIFGFALGIFIIWVVLRLRPVSKIAFVWIREQIGALQENLTASTADPYIQDLVFRLDNHHLANPLFPLRQIIVAPRLIAPCPATDPSSEDQQIDRYHSIFPPLPDWNTLSGIYQSPSIPVMSILETDANFLITGDLGTGKTTALSFMALSMIQQETRRSTDDQRLVIFVHANDILSNLSEDQQELIKPLFAAARQAGGSSLSSFIPRFLKSQLNTRRALLFIDGFDELPAPRIAPVAKWLMAFSQEYPQHQIIASGPSKGYDGLIEAGRFVALSISPWSNHELESFLSKWAHAWQTYVQPSIPKGSITEVDPVLLNAWLKVSRTVFDPLEATLKVWASYVGDIKTPTLTDALHAYVQRMLSPNEQHAAQFIAMNWIRTRIEGLREESIDRRAPVQDLVDAKILLRHSKGEIGFVNPNVGAFLAARGLALEEAPRISFNDEWQPGAVATRYYASIADMTESIKGIKQHMNDPLNKVLLASAAWLRDAPVDAKWRNHILSPLAVLIQNKSQPYGMRLRALHAIVSANEKSAEALVKKMLDSSSVESRIIGALGLGGLCAEESVPELLARNTPEESDEVRLAINLLEGDDADQLFAAEALASHDGEGFAMLEEAAAMEGVRIRRAATHGLGRVINKRADELLSRIEIEDDQAIVRNVATEMLEQRRGDLWDLSPPADDLSNLPWLIAFATEGGLGITPGKGAYETLRRALSVGSKHQRIAALEAVSRYGAQDLVLDVLKAMEAEDMEVKNAAYEALWYLSASGVNYGAAFKSDKVDQPTTK